MRRESVICDSKTCARGPTDTIKRRYIVLMAARKVVPPHSTSILDYPASLSNYERESLAAEAKLAAKKKKATEKVWRELARQVSAGQDPGEDSLTSHRR